MAVLTQTQLPRLLLPIPGNNSKAILKTSKYTHVLKTGASRIPELYECVCERQREHARKQEKPNLTEWLGHVPSWSSRHTGDSEVMFLRAKPTRTKRKGFNSIAVQLSLQVTVTQHTRRCLLSLIECCPWMGRFAEASLRCVVPKGTPGISTQQAKEGREEWPEPAKHVHTLYWSMLLGGASGTQGNAGKYRGRGGGGQEMSEHTAALRTLHLSGLQTPFVRLPCVHPYP